MKRVQKLKIAVNIALLYLIVLEVITLVKGVTSGLINGINIKTDTLGGPVYHFSGLLRALGFDMSDLISVLIIIALLIVSILLKKKSAAEEKPLIWLTTGILLAISSIINIFMTNLPSFIRFFISMNSQLAYLKEVKPSIVYGNPSSVIEQLIPMIFSIIFVVLQLAVGICFILLSRKKLMKNDIKPVQSDAEGDETCPDEKMAAVLGRTQMITIALNISIYYSIISLIFSFLSMTPNLLFNDAFSRFNYLFVIYTPVIPGILVIIMLIIKSKFDKMSKSNESLSKVAAGLILLISPIKIIIIDISTFVIMLKTQQNIDAFPITFIFQIGYLIVMDLASVGIGLFLLLTNLRRDQES